MLDIVNSAEDQFPNGLYGENRIDISCSRDRVHFFP